MPLGAPGVGVGTLGGDFVRSTPTVTVVSPTGTVTTPTVTVTWSYSSLAARAQASYRIQFLSQDRTITLYDSATIAGSTTSLAVPFNLSPGSTYVLIVSASDGLDTGTAEGGFTFDGSAATATTPERAVGSVYEVGVNGVGLMLADHPEKEIRYERRVIPLDSPRLSTSETPFSQAIDRYTLAGAYDWSAGSGQLAYNREGSDPARYRKSDGIDPFSVPGSARLAPNGTLKHSSAYANSRAVIAGGGLYVLTADGQFANYATPSTVSPTTFTISGAGAYRSICSDGTNWYYSDGSNIYRNNTAASAAAWSTVDAFVVQWCVDRVFAARIGTGSKPNVLVELNSTGAEVGGARVWTLQPETEITSITAGDGYVWFTGTRGDKSAIFAVKLGADDSYITALEIPAGLIATNIGFYQGNLMIRAVDLAGDATIYRCATSAGKLTATKVLEIPAVGGLSQAVGDFTGDDRYIYFSWRQMGETLLNPTKTGSGVGVIDLTTGGWSKWMGVRQSTTEATGAVGTILSWYGRPVFTVDGYGAVHADAPSGGDDGTVNSGQFETSLYDLGTSLRKVWGEVTVTFDPIPVNGSVQVFYSVDGGASYTALTAATTAGSKSARWSLNVESDTVSFKVALAGTTASPVFRTLTVRAYPVGLADQILTLPVNCADIVAGLNGKTVPGSTRGAGSARARWLESLVQTRVAVQDIDWPVTGATTTYDLIGVETRSVGVYDRAVNRQSQAMVAVLTLRRNYK